MNTILPLLSTIVTLIFAVAVFDQYLARRRPYQLLWAVGLGMYMLGTLMEFIAGAIGVSSAILRVWYACGAMLTAAYLGMGTVYLLFPGRGTNVVMAVLVIASVFAVYKVAVSPVDMAALGAHELSGSKAFPSGFGGPRLLTPFFNTFGAVTLVGGALWSAWSFWRRRIYPHRVVSNILIALGALAPVWGGSLARAGNPSYLYLSELLGVTIIFLGFLRNKEVFGLYRFPLVHGFKRVS
ncbi:MAG: hypothetical protein HYY32_04875 [Chloroflexi bacterium]|nr:hypothetical protein [Chloroflexota bacterium]